MLLNIDKNIKLYLIKISIDILRKDSLKKIFYIKNNTSELNVTSY